jgi:hypothetical protein
VRPLPNGGTSGERHEEGTGVTIKRPSRRTALIIAGVVLLGLGGAGLFAYQVVRMGFHKGPDAAFGDQHLKTVVALLELHRVRTGEYPAKLVGLKYPGAWDQIALSSVRYCPAADRKSYVVEVTRGWIGKPALTFPADFWSGTGYRASLVKDCP